MHVGWAPDPLGQLVSERGSSPHVSPLQPAVQGSCVWGAGQTLGAPTAGLCVAPGYARAHCSWLPHSPWFRPSNSLPLQAALCPVHAAPGPQGPASWLQVLLHASPCGFQV